MKNKSNHKYSQTTEQARYHTKKEPVWNNRELSHGANTKTRTQRDYFLKTIIRKPGTSKKDIFSTQRRRAPLFYKTVFSVAETRARKNKMALRKKHCRITMWSYWRIRRQLRKRKFCSGARVFSLRLCGTWGERWKKRVEKHIRWKPRTRRSRSKSLYGIKAFNELRRLRKAYAFSRKSLMQQRLLNREIKLEDYAKLTNVANLKTRWKTILDAYYRCHAVVDWFRKGGACRRRPADVEVNTKSKNKVGRIKECIHKLNITFSEIRLFLKAGRRRGALLKGSSAYPAYLFAWLTRNATKRRVIQRAETKICVPGSTRSLVVRGKSIQSFKNAVRRFVTQFKNGTIPTCKFIYTLKYRCTRVITLWPPEKKGYSASLSGFASFLNNYIHTNAKERTDLLRAQRTQYLVDLAQSQRFLTAPQQNSLKTYVPIHTSRWNPTRWEKLLQLQGWARKNGIILNKKTRWGRRLPRSRLLRWFKYQKLLRRLFKLKIKVPGELSVFVPTTKHVTEMDVITALTGARDTLRKIFHKADSRWRRRIRRNSWPLPSSDLRKQLKYHLKRARMSRSTQNKLIALLQKPHQLIKERQLPKAFKNVLKKENVKIIRIPRIYFEKWPQVMLKKGWGIEDLNQKKQKLLRRRVKAYRVLWKLRCSGRNPATAISKWAASQPAFFDLLKKIYTVNKEEDAEMENYDTMRWLEAKKAVRRLKKRRMQVKKLIKKKSKKNRKITAQHPKGGREQYSPQAEELISIARSRSVLLQHNGGSTNKPLWVDVRRVIISTDFQRHLATFKENQLQHENKLFEASCTISSLRSPDEKMAEALFHELKSYITTHNTEPTKIFPLVHKDQEYIVKILRKLLASLYGVKKTGLSVHAIQEAECCLQASARILLKTRRVYSNKLSGKAVEAEKVRAFLREQLFQFLHIDTCSLGYNVNETVRTTPLLPLTTRFLRPKQKNIGGLSLASNLSNLVLKLTNNKLKIQYKQWELRRDQRGNAGISIQIYKSTPAGREAVSLKTRRWENAYYTEYAFLRRWGRKTLARIKKLVGPSPRTANRAKNKVLRTEIKRIALRQNMQRNKTQQNIVTKINSRTPKTVFKKIGQTAMPIRHFSTVGSQSNRLNQTRQKKSFKRLTGRRPKPVKMVSFMKIKKLLRQEALSTNTNRRVYYTLSKRREHVYCCLTINLGAVGVKRLVTKVPLREWLGISFTKLLSSRIVIPLTFSRDIRGITAKKKEIKTESIKPLFKYWISPDKKFFLYISPSFKGKNPKPTNVAVKSAHWKNVLGKWTKLGYVPTLVVLETTKQKLVREHREIEARKKAAKQKTQQLKRAALRGGKQKIHKTKKLAGWVLHSFLKHTAARLRRQKLYSLMESTAKWRGRGLITLKRLGKALGKREVKQVTLWQSLPNFVSVAEKRAKFFKWSDSTRGADHRYVNLRLTSGAKLDLPIQSSAPWFWVSVLERLRKSKRRKNKRRPFRYLKKYEKKEYKKERKKNRVQKVPRLISQLFRRKHSKKIGMTRAVLIDNQQNAIGKKGVLTKGAAFFESKKSVIKAITPWWKFNKSNDFLRRLVYRHISRLRLNRREGKRGQKNILAQRGPKFAEQVRFYFQKKILQRRYVIKILAHRMKPRAVTKKLLAKKHRTKTFLIANNALRFPASGIDNAQRQQLFNVTPPPVLPDNCSLNAVISNTSREATLAAGVRELIDYATVSGLHLAQKYRFSRFLPDVSRGFVQKTFKRRSVVPSIKSKIQPAPLQVFKKIIELDKQRYNTARNTVFFGQSMLLIGRALVNRAATKRLRILKSEINQRVGPKKLVPWWVQQQRDRWEWLADLYQPYEIDEASDFATVTEDYWAIGDEWEETNVIVPRRKAANPAVRTAAGEKFLDLTELRQLKVITARAVSGSTGVSSNFEFCLKTRELVKGDSIKDYQPRGGIDAGRLVIKRRHFRKRARRRYPIRILKMNRLLAIQPRKRWRKLFYKRTAQRSLFNSVRRRMLKTGSVANNFGFKIIKDAPLVTAPTPLHFNRKTLPGKLTAAELKRWKAFLEEVRRLKYRRLTEAAEATTTLIPRLISRAILGRPDLFAGDIEKVRKVIRSLYWSLRIYLGHDLSSWKDQKATAKNLALRIARAEIKEDSEQRFFSKKEFRLARHRFQPYQLTEQPDLEDGARIWLRQFVPLNYELFAEDADRFKDLSVSPLHVKRTRVSSLVIKKWKTGKTMTPPEIKLDRLSAYKFSPASARYENILIQTRRTPVVTMYGSAAKLSVLRPTGLCPAHTSFFTRRFSTYNQQLVGQNVYDRVNLGRRFATIEEEGLTQAYAGFAHRELKGRAADLAKAKQVTAEDQTGPGSIDTRFSRSKSPRNSDYLIRLPDVVSSRAIVVLPTSLQSLQVKNQKVLRDARQQRSDSNKLKFLEGARTNKPLLSKRELISTRRAATLRGAASPQLTNYFVPVNSLFQVRTHDSLSNTKLRYFQQLFIKSGQASHKKDETIVKSYKLFYKKITQDGGDTLPCAKVGGQTFRSTRSVLQLRTASLRADKSAFKQALVTANFVKINNSLARTIQWRRANLRIRSLLLKEQLKNNGFKMLVPRDAQCSLFSRKNTRKQRIIKRVKQLHFPSFYTQVPNQIVVKADRPCNTHKLPCYSVLHTKIKQFKLGKATFKAGGSILKRSAQAVRAALLRRPLTAKFRLTKTTRQIASLRTRLKSSFTGLGVEASILKKRALAQEANATDRTVYPFKFRPIRTKIWDILSLQRNKKHRYLKHWLKELKVGFRNRFWQSSTKEPLMDNERFKAHRSNFRRLTWRDADDTFDRDGLQYAFTFHPINERRNSAWLESLLIKRSLYRGRRFAYRRLKFPQQYKYRRWLQRVRQIMYRRKLSHMYIRGRKWPMLRMYSRRLIQSLFKLRNRKAALKRANKGSTGKRPGARSGLEKLGVGFLDRLDVNLLLLKLAPTLFWARLMVTFGLLRVNGVRVGEPDFRFTPGDWISWDRTKIKDINLEFDSPIKNGFAKKTFVDTSLAYPKNFSYFPKIRLARFIRLPQLEDLPEGARVNLRAFRWYVLDSRLGK